MIFAHHAARDADTYVHRPWTPNPNVREDLLRMQFLPDGTYDVIVIDADATDGGDVHAELTITMGPFVGHVVALRGHDVEERGRAPVPGDPLSLLGVAGTMRVREGVPTFRPDRA